MDATPGWNKLRGQVTGLFRRAPRKEEAPSTEAEARPEPGGNGGSAPKRLIRAATGPFKRLGDRAAEAATDRLANVWKRVLIEAIDERLEAVDQAAARVVQRYVAAVAIGLWGATTAAAISLALSAAVGGQPEEWLIYILIVSGVVGLWNVAAAWHYVRLFRQLEGNTQRRVLTLVASKVGVKGGLIIAAPVAALLVLGIARLILPVP